MSRAEVYSLVAAFLLGISFACIRPSLLAFIGWPAGCLSVVLGLAAIGRIS